MLLALALMVAPPPPDWKVLPAADQSFEVLVPKTAARTGTRSRTLRGGGVAAKVQVTYAVAGDLTLTAESLALSGPGVKGLSTDDLHKLVADADVDDGWRVGPLKNGGAAGLPGATYTATNGTESKRVQLAQDRGRLYVLAATGPADAVKGDTAEQFLTSLLPTPEKASATPAKESPKADKPAEKGGGFAKPPGKGKKPAEVPGDVPEWLTDPAKMIAPDAPVHGVIKGKPFTVEKCELRGGILTLRSGAGFFPDAEATIIVFSNDSPAGQVFLVGGRKAAGSGHTPHIHLKRMDPGDRLPDTNIVSSNYGLRLEYGPVRNGKITGKLYLCCPDTGKGETSIAGKFEAAFDGR